MPSFPLEVRLDGRFGSERSPQLQPLVSGDKLPEPVFPQHPEFLTDEAWPGDGERHWPVSKILANFHELAGPSFYRRIDVHVDRAAYPETKRRLLEELVDTPPTDLAGQKVTRTQALTTNDGFKFFVDDGSWLLIRTSGTEPLVRVYTEATSPDARDALVGAGEKLVRG